MAFKYLENWITFGMTFITVSSSPSREAFKSNEFGSKVTRRVGLRERDFENGCRKNLAGCCSGDKIRSFSEIDGSSMKTRQVRQEDRTASVQFRLNCLV